MTGTTSTLTGNPSSELIPSVLARLKNVSKAEDIVLKEPETGKLLVFDCPKSAAYKCAKCDCYLSCILPGSCRSRECPCLFRRHQTSTGKKSARMGTQETDFGGWDGKILHGLVRKSPTITGRLIHEAIRDVDIQVRCEDDARLSNCITASLED